MEQVDEILSGVGCDGGEAGLGVPLLKSEHVDEIMSSGVGCDGGDAGQYGLYALITDVNEIDTVLHVIVGVIVDNRQQTGDGPREEAEGLLDVNGLVVAVRVLALEYALCI